jgi:hypothetical protein
MVDWRVEVEEDGQVHGLLGVEQLVLEAEALYFVEVESSLIRVDLVNRYPWDGLIRSIVYLIEGKTCLTSIHHQAIGHWLELPR